MSDDASAVIKCEYLLNLALEKYLGIEKDQMKIRQFIQKLSKIKLFKELEKVFQYTYTVKQKVDK
ncbi:unnamed protein product [Paramecium octaurelia]|uniref:Uncharacterized protein n=1 Tax=Paramecium octaurelia TaxID=43137 RepID=A0A8S1SQV1_PAROT|nr:unnamed protein product [Paramecium octaurelia]